jgi:DNA damage-binding protein 1
LAFKEVSAFASMFIAQHLLVSSALPDLSGSQEDDRLVVGDGMRSIFVLEVDPESGIIYSDVRDMATHQVMALEGLNDNGKGVVIADVR